MKIKLFFTVLILSIAGTSISQLTFSVSPGLSMNGASFGYKLGKIVPFIGIQYFGTSTESSYTDEYYDYETNSIQKDEFTSSQNINIFIPNIGVKYFFYESEKIKASAIANFIKPIVSAEIMYDGEPDEFFEEPLNAVKAWGGELSFGVEYFFDEQFSVGGEFGFRYLQASMNYSESTTIYHPITFEEIPSEYVYNSKINAKPTFSRVSLNFYF